MFALEQKPELRREGRGEKKAFPPSCPASRTDTACFRPAAVVAVPALLTSLQSEQWTTLAIPLLHSVLVCSGRTRDDAGIRRLALPPSSSLPSAEVLARGRVAKRAVFVGWGDGGLEETSAKLNKYV